MTPCSLFSLKSTTDWNGFDRSLRCALAQGISPANVDWSILGLPSDSSSGPTEAGQMTLPWRGSASDSTDSSSPQGDKIRLPGEFAELAKVVLLHNDPTRFRRLYAYCFRMRQNPMAWQDSIDEQRVYLERMAKEVKRDIHKMHAFVRFERFCGPQWPQGEKYFAWFEPEHYIVDAVSEFFVKRFSSMPWAILTPRGCLDWNGRQLLVGRPASRAQMPKVPSDRSEGQSLWLTYYQSIFNPARLNTAAMRREMPIRYWPNMPETVAIPGLVASAPARVEQMISDAGCGKYFTAPLRAQKDQADPKPSRLTLPQLNRLLNNCKNCDLAQHATQAVPGAGSLGASIMVVGEQPGDHEDLQGEPFVGPAGKFLRSAMNELGWSRSQVYLTNAVKHFKYQLHGKRRIHKTPLQREIAACRDWLEHEINLLQPKIIIALGRTALHQLLPMGQGQRSDQIPVAAVEHPAALLRAGHCVGSPAYQAWKEKLRQAAMYR